MLKLKAKYANATEFFWVQEEPENMGAWPYMCRKFRKSELRLDVISRKESASTATGYAKQHTAQQMYIVGKAFESAVSEKGKAGIKKTVEKMAETSAD